ncbi:hypothetical protein B0H13DRAFT_2393818 [Mycena leptocephala]|nr:hypothetical protein B0H13DRAFT_2393818 [Mycena leptocephala]
MHCTVTVVTKSHEKLANIAPQAEKGTNYKYLNHGQMKDLLVERTKENNDLKLKSLNMSRQLATFARKMGDYERPIMAIATNEVPRINALISSAIRNGAGLNTIIGQILEAVQGLLIASADIPYYILSITRLTFPHSIENSANFVKITPTLGPVSFEEICANIKKVTFEPRALAGKTGKHGGVVLMMDEVAIEEHFDYFPNENKVGGLCQKHSGSTPFSLQTYKSTLMIVEKLREGEAWEELGAYIYGDIRNFATDDDPLRCQVGYKMFCVRELNMHHPLYPILSSLPGLNLLTGPKLILQTFDWPHIIKHHDQTSMDKLLNPDDSQDVPCAIDLIEAIISWREVKAASNDIDLASTTDSVRLLGHVLENFTLPFITPDVSLSTQIRMLSTCAHLLFVLFREYRTDFMSNYCKMGGENSVSSTRIQANNTEFKFPDSKNNEWRVKRVVATCPDVSPWFRPMAVHAIVYQDTSTFASRSRGSVRADESPLSRAGDDSNTNQLYGDTQSTIKNVPQCLTHLTGIEDWVEMNPEVVDKLRRKWYTHTSHLTGSDVTANIQTHITPTQADALCAEPAGRTGDIDSETEQQDMGEEAEGGQE